MGANTRNRYGISRRFSVCYRMEQDAHYLDLLCCYMLTKETAQNGKQEHLEHMQSIQALHDYLAKAEIKHQIQHN